jgi:hypothetical protein
MTEKLDRTKLEAIYQELCGIVQRLDDAGLTEEADYVDRGRILIQEQLDAVKVAEIP